jgi:hypothetical protein
MPTTPHARITQPTASATCAVLAAVDHIHVSALVRKDGIVELHPIGHALSIVEEVFVLRAFGAVTDLAYWYAEVAPCRAS